MTWGGIDAANSRQLTSKHTYDVQRLPFCCCPVAFSSTCKAKHGDVSAVAHGDKTGLRRQQHSRFRRLWLKHALDLSELSGLLRFAHDGSTVCDSISDALNVLVGVLQRVATTLVCCTQDAIQPYTALRFRLFCCSDSNKQCSDCA